jgi:hypothetical protein
VHKRRIVYIVESLDVQEGASRRAQLLHLNLSGLVAGEGDAVRFELSGV